MSLSCTRKLNSNSSCNPAPVPKLTETFPFAGGLGLTGSEAAGILGVAVADVGLLVGCETWHLDTHA